MVVGFLAILGLSQPEKVTVGATAGNDFYSPVWFAQTATVGGNVFATSSVGAVTYTAATIQNASLIQHTAASALTATLPASSTLGAFVPKAGDSRTIFVNPITTLITFAGGTGTDLHTSSSTKNCNAGAMCRLDFVRKSNSDIEVFFSPGS